MGKKCNDYELFSFNWEYRNIFSKIALGRLKSDF
jgi:hypothetical protein